MTVDLISTIMGSQVCFAGITELQFDGQVTVQVTSERHAGAHAFSVPVLRTVSLSYQDIQTWSPTMLRRVVRHELAHLALYTVTEPRLVPAWFSEGYAQWASDAFDCQSRSRITVAILASRKRVPDILRLDGPWPPDVSVTLANDLYASAVDYLASLTGISRFGAFLGAIRRLGFAAAVERTLGLTPSEFETQWQSYIVRIFASLSALDAECTQPEESAAP